MCAGHHRAASDPRQPPSTAQQPPELLLHGWAAQQVRSPSGVQALAGRGCPLGGGGPAGERPREPVLKQQHSPLASEAEATGIRGSPGWGPCAGLILIALTCRRQPGGPQASIGCELPLLCSGWHAAHPGLAEDHCAPSSRRAWRKLQTLGLPGTAGPTPAPPRAGQGHRRCLSAGQAVSEERR